jgi:LysR family transcriptional regulator, glycine cleavage system transcriptional activator
MWLARRLAEFSVLHPETPVNAVIEMESRTSSDTASTLAVVHVPDRALRPGDALLLREGRLRNIFPIIPLTKQTRSARVLITGKSSP